MNKLVIASLLFLLMVPLASATPVMQNISVQPSPAWIGEDINISLSCIDDANNSISQVYANIVGPGVTLPTQNFAGLGNYYLTVSKEYFDNTGQYNVTIFCRNNLSSTMSNATSFNVSRLTGYISDINPDPSYVGDTIEIDFIAEKNGEKISSGVFFNVSLNGELKPLKVFPAYDSIRGWILKINSPNNADEYNVDVTAFYDRASVSTSDNIDIRNNVEFEIISVDKSSIQSNDNITVKLKALERGSVIDLDENDIDIRIGSYDATVTSVSRQGDEYSVKVIAPNLYSGTYQLEAYMNYNGSSYSESIPIDYVVSILGSMVDLNNKAITTKIKFIQGGATKLTVSTDAYGYYSNFISPGLYDLEVSFPKSTLYLYDVLVNDFDDPIRYFYGDDFDVPGIRNAGLHSFELDLTYSSAEIEMAYNEKNVIDENDLEVFKCSNWNSGKKICNDDWIEVGYEIDTIRNKVKLSTSTLSAFVIGEVKDIKVDFGFDKELYNLEDEIKISGIVKDNDGNSVSNASINIYVKNTQLNYNILADNNGVFSTEIPVPENEGEYTLVLKATSPPYKDFRGEKNFKVTKSKSVYIDFPDTVKIARGDNFTQEFYLLNNGQADMNGLIISVEGIPENYYRTTPIDIDLEPDEKKYIRIDFSIPVYAETGISSATLRVEGGNISEEKVFGLNIFEENAAKPSPTGLITGFVLPEISYLEIVYIILFALLCFSIAIILKKRKTGGKRDDIRGFLFGIGKYLNYEMHENRNKGNYYSYDRLIITEFPNVLKFSKELKEKGGK